MIITRIFVLALAGLSLAGCETSQRFGGPGFGSARLGPPPRAAGPDRVIAAPAPQVETAPLGSPIINTPPPIDPLSPGAGAGLTVPAAPFPAQAQPSPADLRAADAGVPPELRQRPPSGQQTASLPPPSSAPSPASAPTRSGVTGNWTLTEGAGGKCRVLLSSAPVLDLSKASSTGCGSREMQRISAWELRGSDIYLYEPGGAVAGRLQQSGQGRFAGAAAKTGAPITLSK